MKWLINPIKAWRHRKAVAQPFPQAWNDILEKTFPLDQRLPDSDQQRLRRLIQIFISDISFEGALGLMVTDEIRVTIAAQACLLLLQLKEDSYPGVDSVIVYPASYRARVEERLEGGLIRERDDFRLGETSKHGAVVLSWQDVQFGAADIHDGHNVVLHEFAHQLDLEDHAPDGTPVLPRWSRYVAWARVFSENYEQLKKDVAHHHHTVMNAYGATNPAEFFAVATETFFEKPHALKKKHPNLYEQLRLFYGQDPTKYVA